MSLRHPSGRGKSRGRGWLVALAGLALLFVAPQLVAAARYDDRIYRGLAEVPAATYGVVFGAYVNEDRTLSAAAQERIEAAVLLYQQGRIEKLFVSGDNRSNGQVEAIAAYAAGRGVAREDIVLDPLGIDTHDTCRHLAQRTGNALLLSQGYHLPRVLYMCEREGVDARGLAVNRLGLLADRGGSALEIWSTRAYRFLRESALTWLFAVGLYDRLSTEAERLEQP